MLTRSIRLALLLLAVAPAAAAHAASLWTPLASGTSADITAVAAPQAGEVVYATGSGTIYYLNGGGTFTQASVTPTPPLGFTGVAMSTSGVDGVAVGEAGEIYYSTDSGLHWTKNTTTHEYTSGDCTSGWTGSHTLNDALNSVKFAPNSTVVYVTGANNDVLKSTDGGLTFTEVNKTAGGCIANSNGAFSDTFWLSSSVGYLISNQFGELWVTTDGLSSATEDDSSGAINGYDETTTLAIDTANPSHMWAAAGGGLSEGITYSTNGGSSFTGVNFESAQSETNLLEDIANNGTTVVAAALNGDIWTSPDGVNFYDQVAPPPYSTTNWNAVAMVPGTNTAIVGGASGALVITSKANTLPDTIPPTGSISGPATLSPGQYGTYKITATDNPGGSGVNPSSFVWSIPGQASQTGASATFAFPTAGHYTVTVSFSDLAGNTATATFTITVNAPPPSGSGQKNTTTGGATVGIFKKVTVSGRKGRYIPIYLLDKTPRKFVITLLTVRRKHKPQKTLAKLTTILKKGHAVAHLQLPGSVKSGSYELEVRLYTTGKHSKAVGKRIKQLFVLD